MGTSDPVHAQSDRALQALADGSLDEATEAFAQAVHENPRDASLRQRLGELLARQGRTRAAVKQFQHVAGQYAASGHLLKAIAICRVILAMEPAHRETQATLARLYALQSEGTPTLRSLPSSMSAAVDPHERPTEENAPLHLEMQNIFAQEPARSAQGTKARAHAAPEREEPVAGSQPPQPEAKLQLEAIAQTPLFSKLSPEAFTEVVQTLALRWVKAGETVVAEGDLGDSMFVVVDGLVNVIRGRPEAGGKPIALLGEGSFFGEMALVTGTPRLASVIAARDGLLFEIDAELLQDLASRHPAIREVVAEFYRGRLLTNLLSSSPLFRAFSPEERSRIASRFRLHSLPGGAQILEEGKPGAGLFIILRGQGEAFHSRADGTRLSHARLREGDVFGEISLLFGTPCTASVRAVGHLELLELPAPDFAELVLPHPRVKAMIERMARERLTATTDLLAANDEVADGWLV